MSQVDVNLLDLESLPSDGGSQPGSVCAGSERDRSEYGDNYNQNKPSKWKSCLLYALLFFILVSILFVNIAILILVPLLRCDCSACVTCGVGITASTVDQTALSSDFIQEMRATFKNFSDFIQKDKMTLLETNNYDYSCNGSSSQSNTSLDQVPGNPKAILTDMSVSLQQVLKTTGDSMAMLTNIVDTLANHDSTSVSTAGTMNDILLITQKLLQLQNVSSLLNSILPVSCKDIKAILPNSPTGYYHVNSRTIYCNMDTLCSGNGGWTRLAYLDMSDATQNCPPGFRLYRHQSVRACGRASSSGGSCTSVKFPSNGISYSQVCGKVVGYQYGTTDAVQDGQSKSIDSYYVDGVSITRGSPRLHVWTLMAGFIDRKDKGSCGRRSICPCTDSCLSSLVHSFIGSHYFCESAASSSPSRRLYTSDPLWDGQGCRNNERPCCSVSGLPWFHRDYGSTIISDYLELRVCGSASTGNEDSPVRFYEIYVK